MLSRHYQTYEPDYTLAQKIAVVFALVLIAIIGAFIYEFIQDYRTQLNQALLYGLGFLGVLFLIICTFGAFYLFAMLTLHYQNKRLYAEQQRQLVTSAVANNQLFIATAKQMEAGQIYLTEQRTSEGVVKFKSLPKPKDNLKSEPKPTAPLAIALPEPKNSVLSDIGPLQRILIVGGQNSGKTTLLKHIAKQRGQTGNVLILDSHNHAGKWNDDYRIVGHGRDYQAIETELRNLVSVMDSRYKEYASGRIGERGHDLITVISDEFTTIAENINGLDAYLLPLLTESRKVGIDFIVACHSETAGSLGLKGRFDLKKNFDAVLRLKNYSGKRLIHLDNGEDIIEYAHCGEFKELYSIKPSQSFTNKLDAILNEDLIKTTAIIDKYHDLKNSNSFSWNKLAIAVYGKKGGHYITELKSVLNAHNIHFTD